VLLWADLLFKVLTHMADNSGDRFLPRDTTQSVVMPQYVVCPSVRLSVTFRYRDHIRL